MVHQLTQQDYAFLSEKWREWTRAEALGKYKLSMKYLDLTHLFAWFVDTCKKYEVPSSDPNPPYYGEVWDLLDNSVSSEENQKILMTEIKRIGSPEAAMAEEVEEITSLPDLLDKLGAPSLPDIDDPLAQQKLEEIIRELSERLKDAEPMVGKIKVQVAGKTHIWGSAALYKFVDGLNERIRTLEADKEKLLAEKQQQPQAPKMVTVRMMDFLPQYRSSVDGQLYGPYNADQIVTLNEHDADLLIRQGAAELYAIRRETSLHSIWVNVEAALIDGDFGLLNQNLKQLQPFRLEFKP